MIRRSPWYLLVLTALGLLPGYAADDPVSETHQLTLQWTRLEHQKDTLEANWRNYKPVLEQQLVLLEREIRDLGALLETSEQQQDAVEQKRLELLQEQTLLEQDQAQLERSLVQATIALHGMHPQLPPPLQSAWNAELSGLDDPLATTSEKLQLLLELLGMLDDFGQKISLHESVMTLADGQDYLVRQVYLGLSHGWYVTADQRFAASGRANPDAWLWEPADDGQSIMEIIAILERRASPALVSIPLRLAASAVAGGD
jgi:hypothetical protein